MADDEKSEVEETETEEVEEESEEENAEDSNWARMSQLIDERLSEGLKKWQADKEAEIRKKRTTSSSSQSKAAPTRRQGFLSGGFFSGLTDKK